MELICNECGCIFDEDDALEVDIDLEFENGVGRLFPDHHHTTCLCCPECESEDVEEYTEDEEEEE